MKLGNASGCAEDEMYDLKKKINNLTCSWVAKCVSVSASVSEELEKWKELSRKEGKSIFEKLSCELE